MPTNFGMLLGYREVFGGYCNRDPEHYLQYIDKILVWKICSILLHKNFPDPVTNSQLALLDKLISPANNSIKENIKKALDKNFKRFHKSGIFLTQRTSLIILELAVSSMEKNKIFIEEHIQERKFFELYFMVNEEYNTKNLVGLSQPKVRFESYLFIFSMSILHYDLRREGTPALIVAQVSKGVQFFNWAKHDAEVNQICQDFLSSLNYRNGGEFILSILELLKPFLDIKDGHYLELGLEKFENDSMKKYLVINENSEEESIGLKASEYDFLNIREKPIFKNINGSYVCFFEPFLAEKAYKSLYFSLIKHNKKIKNLKSYIGKKFFEEYLFKKCIELIDLSDCEKHFEENSNIKGLPDLKISKNNNIAIFEAKDFMFSAQNKSSQSMEQYKEMISDKLIESKSGSHKGIRQIFNVIKSIIYARNQKGENNLINIYPIIVAPDYVGDVPGLNQFLNYKLFELIESIDTSDNFVNIKPLTLINIDTFILYGSYFKDFDGLLGAINRFHISQKYRTDSKFPDISPEKLFDYLESTSLSFFGFSQNEISKSGHLTISEFYKSAVRTLFGD